MKIITNKVAKVILFLVALTVYKATGIAAPIPSQDIKQVVAFVFVQRDQEGKWNPNGKWFPSGTAFFVGVNSPKNPDLTFAYLVTAKHVLQYKPDPKTPTRKEWFPNIRLRLNTIAGESDFVTASVVVTGDKKTVFLHEEDKTVDLAVNPVRLDAKRFQFKVLPDQMITTEKDFKDLEITEGSEVFFTGLFLPYLGTLKNYPVVRFGKVSLITDEKIKWVDDLESNLYLIESGSYSGNSGAPVYFYLGSDRKPGVLFAGMPIVKLAGVVSGTFLDNQPIKIIETAQVPVAPSSMGIAAVVPAYKLYEIIFGNELTRKREQ